MRGRPRIVDGLAQAEPPTLLKGRDEPRLFPEEVEVLRKTIREYGEASTRRLLPDGGGLSWRREDRRTRPRDPRLTIARIVIE